MVVLIHRLSCHGMFRHAKFRSFLCVLLAMCMWGCGGDEEHPSAWQGTWKLDEITIDGKRDQDYAGNWVWKFQDDVVEIDEINEMLHERTPHLGTWSCVDNKRVMTLCFNHHDNEYPSGEGPYSPPAGIYITEKIAQLEVVRQKGSNAVLTLKDSDLDRTITYFLTKW